MANYNVENSALTNAEEEQLKAMLAFSRNKNFVKEGDKPAFYFVEAGSVEALKEKMQGIPFAHFRLPNGENVFMVHEEDVVRADVATNQLRVEQMENGVIPRNLLYDKANGQVECISDLSNEELLMFDAYAKDRGIQISIERGDSLLFDRKDAEVVHRISDSIAYDRSNPDVWDVMVRNRVLEDKSSLLQNVNSHNHEPFYIADDRGSVAYVTNNSFQKDGEYIEKPPLRTRFGSIRETAADKKIKEKIVREVTFMEHPVELTKEQYEKYRRSYDKEEFLQKIREENGIKEPTKEEQELIRKHEQNRSRMEQCIRENSPNPDGKVNGELSVPENVLNIRNGYAHTEVESSLRIAGYAYACGNGKVVSRSVEQINTEYTTTNKNGITEKHQSSQEEINYRDYTHSRYDMSLQAKNLIEGEKVSDTSYQFYGEITGNDANGNGVRDAVEFKDENGNDIPDEYENLDNLDDNTDKNHNGIPDEYEDLDDLGLDGLDDEEWDYDY